MLLRPSRYDCRLVALCLTWFVIAATIGRCQETEPSSEKSAVVVAMQQQMTKLRVTISQDSGEDRCELNAEPILRYSDPARQFPDATLWMWTSEGCPAVVSKLEQAREGNTVVWQYCLAGASDGRAIVRWPDETVWKATRPGLKWNRLQSSEMPRTTPTGRLLQFRGLARNFACTVTSHEGEKQEMRLLPQPLFRYSGEARKILDGAVFGFASNGTNPDGLVILQVRQMEDDADIWEYGIVGLSGETVTFRYDGVTVFEHEAAKGPGHHGHWLWLVTPME